ncbi:MAG: nucleotidyl transferase AbiEii/AbiGii toxin family protein [Candidatus Edwardsbacteria bacterium]
MGKTILTTKQSDFLELVSEKKQVTENFYLTGGTALSEFYLKHRISEDLDFFSEKREVDPKTIEAFLTQISPLLGVRKINRSQFLGLFSYILVYPDKVTLKVDFSYYPFPKIQRGPMYKNLEIASIYDIAVDKVHTLFMQPRARDYIDLYFIMEEKKYSLKKLISDAKAKFDWDIDPITLASQFLRVKEMTDLPKMVRPFKVVDMKNFFLKLAKNLKNEIFRTNY